MSNRKAYRGKRRARRRWMLELLLSLHVLGPELLSWLFSFFLSWAGRFPSAMRTRARAQLAEAYGKSPEDPFVINTVQDMFSDLGRKGGETLGYLRKPFPGLRDIDLNGITDEINRLLAQGKGLLMITGHLGNWEMAAYGLAYAREKRLTVVAKKSADAMADTYIEQWRQSNGVDVVYQHEGVRKILKVLGEGEWLGFLPDQDIKDVGGRFVPFFGKTAWTPSTIAALSQKTGAPIFPMACLWKEDHYQMVYEPAIYPDLEAADKEVELVNLCTQMNQGLEALIRRAPEQWVWFHKRWRTTPENLKVHRDRLATEAQWEKEASQV